MSILTNDYFFLGFKIRGSNAREEINQRINLACELSLFTKNPMGPNNALRG
jgi:hypothetical protein